MINWELLDALETQQKADPAFKRLSPKYTPPEGGENPLAFVIGEAPGAQEEIAGRPFVGPSGVVLRRLMVIAGLFAEEEKADGWDAPPTAPANCWLTNTVKFRPPRNRRPTPAEIEAARLYLTAEWLAVEAPKLIICVGNVPLSAIIKTKMAITRVAGQCLQRTSRKGPCYVWPMIHPSYGIRNPGMRPILEKDWEKLSEWRAINQGPY